MEAKQLDSKFYYVYSCDMEENVRVKIGTLEGKLKKPDHIQLLNDPMLRFSGIYQKSHPDLMLECQIYSNQMGLALPTRASYKSFTNRFDWNEWLTLPHTFRDLPRDAQLAISMYDVVGPGKRRPVGGTTISLFTKKGVFRSGMIDIKVWPDREADGKNPSSTPGKSKDDSEIRRLEKLKKKHDEGVIKRVDWLDRLTFTQVEKIMEKEKKNSDYLYLNIEFPKIIINGKHHHLVYFEKNGDEVIPIRRHREICFYPDPEILKENLCEAKHHILARSVRSGVSDRDAKPTASIRDSLNTIVKYPPTKPLTNEEQDLVWKYRFYLMNQKKALTKFLKCVNWKLVNEAKQALGLVHQWAPMDVEDALELLGPNFEHPGVRRYAVSRLAEAPDEDLLLYLLQLVQALKYENFDEIKEAYEKLNNGKDSIIGSSKDFRDSLSDKLYSSSSDPKQSLNSSKESISQVQALADAINEGLQISPTSSLNSSLVAPISLDLSQKTTASVISSPPCVTVTAPHPTTAGANTGVADDADGQIIVGQDLATFLISRACNHSTLANYFYWYLLIECEDQDPAPVKQDSKVRDMYLTVMKTFSKTLKDGNPEWQKRRTFLAQQQIFMDKLVRLIKTVTRESGNRKKKMERLQALLSEPETFKINFSNFEPFPFPLDPDVIIKGIIPEKAILFKSALMPSKLTFLTIDNQEYVAIFKHGDDLRQDQLILQMITLMDKLLRKENLDLKLTPYRVHATSAKHGFVQFVESTPVAEVLANDTTIQNFFRKYHPCENAVFGISPEVMDTYVKSCAGYCVITYLLGVGDRHLDNLLLTTNGNLFHIDFGYILGRDPKPLPPPMKLSKEMVEAMGGTSNEYYLEFRKQCYTAFLHLRRHANLMLNLFSLMVDASVPDIALEPDKAVKKVQDKLQLHLGDEEAVQYFQTLLDISVTAVMAALVEHLHKFAQYWRK